MTGKILVPQRAPVRSERRRETTKNWKDERKEKGGINAQKKLGWGKNQLEGGERSGDSGVPITTGCHLWGGLYKAILGRVP